MLVEKCVNTTDHIQKCAAIKKAGNFITCRFAKKLLHIKRRHDNTVETMAQVSMKGTLWIICI